MSRIIENRRSRAGAYANREVTLMHWEIVRHIGSVLLGGERAGYGKKDFLDTVEKIDGAFWTEPKYINTGNHYGLTLASLACTFLDRQP